MMKKKYKNNLNKYCLWIVCLFIVSGCASNTKREKIVGIQKVRIKKLEKRLADKQKIIDQMKAEKWAQPPSKVAEAIALQPLKNHMSNKRWVTALRLSNELKKQYPQSRKLAKYRVVIFKKMGLNKQAMDEVNQLKKLRANSKKGSSRRI